MNIQDYPMKCCGMVEAFNIKIAHMWEFNKETKQDSIRYPTAADYDAQFALIEAHQRKHRRNCALISLATYQSNELAAAARAGYKEVFRFWNPNSTYYVLLLTKVLWNTADEYAEAVKAGTAHEPKPVRMWTHAVNEGRPFDPTKVKEPEPVSETTGVLHEEEIRI